MLLDNRFVILSDFNVPGDAAGHLDTHAVDVFTQYSLRQHVTAPTHISGNTLGLILSHDEHTREQLVSKVAVQSVCFQIITFWPAVSECRCCSHESRQRTPSGHFEESTRQPSVSTFCSPGYLVNWTWTQTAMLICSTLRSSECWTSMRRYGQVVVDVASTTVATYRTKHNKPRNRVDDHFQLT